MPKFILNCAVTGAIHTPTMAPYLPIKPQEIAAQAIEATGRSYQTIANAKRVAERVDVSRRREDLSWSHHAEVATRRREGTALNADP